MSAEGRIDDFQTPTNSKPPKRPSHDMEVSPQLAGTFSLSDLKFELNSIFDEKIELHITPLANQLRLYKEQVQPTIKLQERIDFLENENTLLKEKIENLEINARKLNVKVFGIAEKPKEDCENVLLQAINKICPSFNDRTFNSVYRIGSGNNRVILASFAHLKDKTMLFSKLKQLAQQKVYINEDLPKEVEQRRKEEDSWFQYSKLHGYRTKWLGDPIQTDQNYVWINSSSTRKHTLLAIFMNYHISWRLKHYVHQHVMGLLHSSVRLQSCQIITNDHLQLTIQHMLIWNSSSCYKKH